MTRRLLTLPLFALMAVFPLVASATPAMPAWRMQPPFSTETAKLVIGGKLQVTAEIADTFEIRARGLGDRSGLRPGWGMLFVSDKPVIQNFWMKDMRFCLDIIWIEGGRISGAAQNVCPQPGAPDSALAQFSSGTPDTYVLEMPANWLKENGLDAGSTVAMTLPPSA